MSRNDLKKELDESKRLLKWVTAAVFAPGYAQSSRARWLCSFKTLLRIDCGLLTSFLYSDRRHINL